MTKMLTRKEVDELLGRDKAKRKILSPEDAKRLQNGIKTYEDKYNLKSGTVPYQTIYKIAESLEIELELYDAKGQIIEKE